MGFLDRAKATAQRARSGARVAREQGQHRINELQARRQAEVLLREVGLASYEENQGIGGREAVVRAVAKLDEHVRAHNIDLSTSGLRGYLRTATGGGEDGSRAGRSPGADDTDTEAETATDEARKDEPAKDDVPPTAADSPSPGDKAKSADTPDDATDQANTGTGSAGKQSSTKKTTAAKKTAAAAKKTAAKKTTAKKTTTKKTTNADGTGAKKPPADDGQ